MDLTEKTISAEQIFQGKVFSVHVDEVSLPDSKTACREVVDHPGGVCIAAEDARGRLLFVRQYRYPCKQVMLELPAGKLEPGTQKSVLPWSRLRDSLRRKNKKSK